eukprot:m51a1_g6015 hypothetical protein (121) ;mRNA; r:71996-72588
MLLAWIALPAVGYCLLFRPENNHSCGEGITLLVSAKKANSVNIALALAETVCSAAGAVGDKKAYCPTLTDFSASATSAIRGITTAQIVVVILLIVLNIVGLVLLPQREPKTHNNLKDSSD